MYKATIVTFVALAITVGTYASIIPEMHKPMPYTFGYTIKDKHGEQHRQEIGDGVGAVKGSYGFTDERGIHRQVHYVADKAGFRAEVKTNEHGTAPLNPAAVKMISSAHPYFGGAGHKGMLGLGPLAAGPLAAGPFSAGPLAAGPLAAGPLSLAAAPVPFAAPVAYPALGKEALGFGYGGQLFGGAVKGYDSRFGVY